MIIDFGMIVSILWLWMHFEDGLVNKCMLFKNDIW